MSTQHENGKIHDRGFWLIDTTKEDSRWHFHDPKLEAGILGFFEKEKPKSIIDFGCGEGLYVKAFKEAGYETTGYDGNPNTPQLTNGLCGVIDLSTPFYLARKFDWVLSLEVGEHIPPQYEDNFIENLDKHCTNGIILSWAVEGQGGHGHFNCRNNDYIIAKFNKMGYVYDIQASELLRSSITHEWFKNTILVFQKIQTSV